MSPPAVVAIRPLAINATLLKIEHESTALSVGCSIPTANDSMHPKIVFEPVRLDLPLGLLAFLVVWFFFVGGCIGSFLNVVIYRLPLGKSVVSPGSRCPRCGHDIRWFDNLPVFSWLFLRGRCRDCGTSISARYPLVEFLVGIVFLALAVQVLLPGGPWWLTNVATRTFLFESWIKLGAAYCYYQLLFVTLLATTYIAWDGQRAPWSLFLPAILVGLFFPAYWNEVRPLATSAVSWQDTLWQGCGQGLRGALVGLILGSVYDLIHDLRNARGEPRGRLTLATMTIGLMLGWPAVALIAALGAVIASLWPIPWRYSWRAACAAPLAGLTLACAAFILAGRLAFERWTTLIAGRAGVLLAVVGLLVVLSSGAARALTPPPPVDNNTDGLSSPDVIYP